MKMIQNVLCCSVILSLFLLSSPFIKVYACDVIHNKAHDSVIETCEQKEELVIEVENEIETFSYPKNPNYRYTFIWTTPSLSRAVCYECGRSTMSTVNRKSQYAYDCLECPLAYGPGLQNDDFITWDYYKRERCTACGYQSAEWYDRRSYTAICNNGDPMYSPEWSMLENYDPTRDDPHQNLNWWLYRIRY